MSWQSLFTHWGALAALIPLAICSILVIAIALERMWTFARLAKAPADLFRHVEDLLKRGKREIAMEALDDSDTPYARIALSSLQRENATEQETEDVLVMACDAEIAEAGSPLAVVGTIGNIALYIGLFGTVIGIMEAFRKMGAPGGLSGPEQIMTDISQALIATAAGLAVAIVAVVVNNWASNWVEGYRLQLERFATEWSHRLRDFRGVEVTEEAEVEPLV